ncbi:hypothetical protein A2160_05820 [Candidatus Beckwithbacteria bacterium RBG_13_42_9]|uniref:HIT domain-containing protein n=1 Tax=Candidatus Beckwithbacteria bacterium RBG_13_42_9 TaxID=1797457 RepID=A0A1F5E666_9BACT|nr:MAG: hypothetical protein A2160_05820 [Candidatus Beckwithbacteria bacterium RBG_13_42_9]
MNCPFCQIVSRQIPAHIIYEDDKFLAFLDHRPLTRGSTLVIPKKHYRWVDEVPEFGDYFEVAKKVGLAAKKVLGAIWINYLTIGHEVSHAHIRVIPRYPKDLHGPLPDLSKTEALPEQEMKSIALRLTEAIE